MTIKRILYLSIAAVLLSAVVLESGDNKPILPTAQVVTAQSASPDAPAPTWESVNARFPLYFTPNHGQTDPIVRYYARTPGYTLWMTDNGMIFHRLFKRNGQSEQDVSRLEFIGAAPNPKIEALEKTGHRVCIFKGNDPAKWKTDIPSSNAVLYKALYQNIDLKVYGSSTAVEYDWLVKPGGDPGQIKFRYRDVKAVEIDSRGNLSILTEAGRMTHNKPTAYQVIDGKRITVEAEFIEKGTGTSDEKGTGTFEEATYGIAVGDYDRRRPLVIDPLVLAYATYLGSKLDDAVDDFAVDSQGNVYGVGTAPGLDFPRKKKFLETAEIVIFKLNIADDGSSSLKLSILFGDTHNLSTDRGYGIAVDSAGMIYVAGTTESYYFPTVNPFQNRLKGTSDAFVAKFNPNLEGKNMLVFSTYLGGTNSDSANDIAVDSRGNAYVTGQTFSYNFPVRNADRAASGRVYAYGDAFISKLNTSASGPAALVYSTFLGGPSTDSGNHIAVVDGGYVFISGTTDGHDFPTYHGFQNESGDPGRERIGEVFVAAYDITMTGHATQMLYCTYLGGSKYEEDGAIAVDGSGNVYVTGYTLSPDFPVRNAVQNSLLAGEDAFVVKIQTRNSGSASLIYSTYLGGSWQNDQGTGIALDGDGNAYVTGTAHSANFPQVNPLAQGPGGGESDAFISKLSADGSQLLFSSYLGGSHRDQGVGIGLDGDNNIYVAGNTRSTIFPVTSGAVQSTMKGELANWDYFIAKIQASDDTTPPPTENAEIMLDRKELIFGAGTGGFVTPQQTVFVDNCGAGTMSWSLSDDRSWLHCSPPVGNDTGLIQVTVNPAGLAVGTYNGKVTITAPNAVNSPAVIDVQLTVYSAQNTAAPFGEFATPGNGANVSSSIPVTGWVLDDICVTGVKIYREEGSQLIFIGDAVLTEGSRPDIEAVYPNYPECRKAGWGYMLLTNSLPGGGNGTFTLHARAQDLEGHDVELGRKTIHCDNAHAVKPFGALDTPVSGSIVSGNSYINWGWALTPKPNKIPTDGSTLNVWVDGVKLPGHPQYNLYRHDIAELFPDYANSNGAMGFYYLDTTSYTNGVHTIQWTAVDNAGNTDGIGSRYFTVRNGIQRTASQQAATPPAATQSTATQPTDTFNRFRRNAGKIFTDQEFDAVAGMILKNEPDSARRPIKAVTGFQVSQDGTDIPGKAVTSRQGVYKVSLPQQGRLQLTFPGATELSGRMIVGKKFRTLPIGSHLEPRNGVFSWQPGPAAFGVFRFLFIQADKAGKLIPRQVEVEIVEGK